MRRLLAALAFCLLAVPAVAQDYPYPLNVVKLDQQVSAATVSSFLFTSPNKSLASLTAVVGASAGFVMVLDAASLPANGAVASCTNAAAARPCVMWCAPVAANGMIDRQWTSPMSFTTGVLAAYSTTGCASLTASATAQFFGEAP
jgi:hypothetical protein